MENNSTPKIIWGAPALTRSTPVSNIRFNNDWHSCLLALNAGWTLSGEEVEAGRAYILEGLFKKWEGSDGGYFIPFSVPK